VNRGKWVLAELFNSPPPPPPPDVDTSLSEPEGYSPTSMRAILEAHRESPNCAGCHSLIDPIGLALENFDGLGKWRNEDNGAAIDVKTTLFNGADIDGPGGLREALLDRSDVIVNTITRKLMIFALGRGLDYADAPAVRGIVRDTAAEDFRFSSIVLGVVKSVPFRMRVRTVSDDLPREQPPEQTAGV
jgi:hypothetical protein